MINFFSCQKKIEQINDVTSSETDTSVPSGATTSSTTTTSSPTVLKSLYVTSGACNSGPGMTTYSAATSSKLLTEHSLDSGEVENILLDYNYLGNFATGTHPQTVIVQKSNLLILNENTTAALRSVIIIPKSNPSQFSNYYANATALSGVMRGMSIDTSGNIFIGKTAAVEKINTTPVRVLAGSNAWINNPAGSCAAAATSISSIVALPTSYTVNARVIFSNQGSVTANNRIGIINQNGYYTSTDCIYGTQISSVTHSKASNLTQETVSFNSASGTAITSMVYFPYAGTTATGKIIVSYANGQITNYPSGVYTLNHGIVMWDVNETPSSATLSNPKVLYDDISVVYGISALAFDSETNELYVATGSEPGVTNFTANAAGYNIEKFQLDLTLESDPKLTRILHSNNQPFMLGSIYTRCISGMSIGTSTNQ